MTTRKLRLTTVGSAVSDWTAAKGRAFASPGPGAGPQSNGRMTESDLARPRLLSHQGVRVRARVRLLSQQTWGRAPPDRGPDRAVLETQTYPAPACAALRGRVALPVASVLRGFFDMGTSWSKGRRNCLPYASKLPVRSPPFADGDRQDGGTHALFCNQFKRKVTDSLWWAK